MGFIVFGCIFTFLVIAGHQTLGYDRAVNALLLLLIGAGAGFSMGSKKK